MASDAIANPVRSPLFMVLTKNPQVVMLRKLVRIPRAVFGIAGLAAVLVCAICAKHIAPFDPDNMDFGNLLNAMTAAHWLGSDQLGRDTFSRLVYGSQVALSVSLGAIGLGVLIGVPLGLVSVYFRGWVDDLLMRAMDALTVFPSLLVAVALAATLGSSLTTVILAIGIANVPWIARIVRSQGLSVREQDYVAAAVAGGMSHFGVILKHISTNTLAPVIVQATLGMATRCWWKRGLASSASACSRRRRRGATCFSRRFHS